MGLSELTDQAAVLAAMKECDELGRDRFLDKYGFGEARTYFLEYDGKRYDSKAIAGVAYGIQHGRPLTSEEFSGGDQTVARQLAELGFIVTRPARDWSTPIGTITTKSEIKKLYGGSIYGGIEPSNTTPNVFLYTDPGSAHDHGYKFDEPDAHEAGVFYYTGEGTIGDQQLTHGNRAILDHAEQGRVLRLFEAVDGKPQPGGRLQRYVGAFYLDPSQPYAWKQAPDLDGNMRNVLVFRLRADEVLGYPARPVPPPKATSAVLATKAPEPPAVCPTHFIVLPASGLCDFCAD